MRQWQLTLTGKDLTMPWFTLHKHDDKPDDKHDGTHEADNRTDDQPASAPRTRTLPPHMQRIVDERSAARLRPDASEAEQRDAYERRRMAIQFDIDQGELANSPDNPWMHRIQLLTEALANVEEELRESEKIAPGPYHPVQPLPITNINITRDAGISLSFEIEGQSFAFDEVLDWAERGTQVAVPELVQTSGSASSLVPQDAPADLVEPLQRHLQESIVTFATDLRDRTLDEDPLPRLPTLVDLAKPCPVCGGWTDWKGHCDVCSARKARSQSLFRERTHLMREQSVEAEERHRLAERLALARHRMRDLEADIVAWERSLKR
jgi:hypothetical protein